MKRRLPPVLQVRDYSLSLGSSISYGFGREMVFVAVGWQVYDIARNPFHLGLVGLAEFLLLLVSLNGADELWPFLALSFASGCTAALGNPAIRSMTPTLVPFELLPSAIALRSTVFQGVVVVGPAVGGLLFALGPDIVYATGAVLMLISVAFVLPMKPREIEEAPFDVGGRARGAAPP